MDDRLFFIIISITIIGFTFLCYICLKIGERKYLKEYLKEYENDLIDTHAIREIDRYLDGLTIELPKNYEDIVNDWVNGNISAAEAARQLGFSTTTLYKRFGHMKTIKRHK